MRLQLPDDRVNQLQCCLQGGLSKFYRLLEQFCCCLFSLSFVNSSTCYQRFKFTLSYFDFWTMIQMDKIVKLCKLLSVFGKIVQAPFYLCHCLCHCLYILHKIIEIFISKFSHEICWVRAHLNLWQNLFHGSDKFLHPTKILCIPVSIFIKDHKPGVGNLVDVDLGGEVLPRVMGWTHHLNHAFSCNLKVLVLCIWIWRRKNSPCLFVGPST